MSRTSLNENMDEEETEKYIIEHIKLRSHCFKLRRIGEGSYGRVYCATKKTNIESKSKSISQSLAKIVPVRSLLRGSAKNRTAFAVKIMDKFKNVFKFENALNEAKLIASLRHESIVKCLDYFTITSPTNSFNKIAVAIELELLQLTLTKSFKVAKYKTDASIIKVIQQIGGAIAYLHEKRIVHSDIKCDNIMLSIKGKPYNKRSKIKIQNSNVTFKLVDFGVAVQYPIGCNISRVAEFSFMGTPIFMSPKKLQKDKHNPFENDVYGLCLIILCCISGKNLPKLMNLYDLSFSRRKGNIAKDVFEKMKPLKKFNFIKENPKLYNIIRLTTNGEDGPCPTMAAILEMIES